MDELKPCPFCGGRAYTSINREKQWVSAFYWGVRCKNHECGYVGTYRTEEEVIKAWNQRHKEQTDESPKDKK